MQRWYSNNIDSMHLFYIIIIYIVYVFFFIFLSSVFSSIIRCGFMPPHHSSCHAILCLVRFSTTIIICDRWWKHISIPVFPLAFWCCCCMCVHGEICRSSFPESAASHDRSRYITIFKCTENIQFDTSGAARFHIYIRLVNSGWNYSSGKRHLIALHFISFFSLKLARNFCVCKHSLNLCVQRCDR